MIDHDEFKFIDCELLIEQSFQKNVIYVYDYA